MPGIVLLLLGLTAAPVRLEDVGPDTSRTPATRLAEVKLSPLMGAAGVASERFMEPADTPTVRRRPRAIEHSDAYYKRLTIHRIGSFVILPLFAGEYFLGQNLLKSASTAGWVKPTHVLVATAMGAVFTVNSVTGVWNLVESRNDKDGRALRWIHSLSMLTADAGFVATGMSAHGGHNRFGTTTTLRDNNITHRNLAIGSMSLAAVSTAIMWLRKSDN
jgi:hypothetical protein